MKTASIALVHDWLDAPGWRGAVFAEVLRMYPNADVYTLVDFLSVAERKKLGIGRVMTGSSQ
jgi:hypothetical protein